MRLLTILNPRFRRRCRLIIYGGLGAFVFIYINLFIVAHQDHDEFRHTAGNDPELWLDMDKYHKMQRSREILQADQVEVHKKDEALSPDKLLVDENSKNTVSEIDSYLTDLLVDTSMVNSKSKTGIWDQLSSLVTFRRIHPERIPNLGTLLHMMAEDPVSEAGVGYRGTQLKLTLRLGMQQNKVVFKPRRYNRDDIIEGEPYAGMDRHNGEIAAYHLGRILKFHRTPPAVGRVVNLKEDLLPVSTDQLRSTFIMKDNETCVYGKCYYCNPSYAACSDDQHRLEGVIIFWLPPQWKLKTWRHPWARSYKEGKFALWETDDNYCIKVRSLPLYSNGPRLLDLVDAAIFDFLVGNADRHMYETFDGYPNSTVLLMDNGKSFGNPNLDEMTILAPLYQCCIVRGSTWRWLSKLTGQWVATSLERLTSADPVAPVLASHHYPAIQRRFSTVLETVRKCINANGKDQVVIDDGF